MWSWRELTKLNVATAIALALALSACANRPPDRFVLLPNADGRTSSIIIHTAKGDYPVASHFGSVELHNGVGTSKALSQDEVRQRYTELYEAQPARPTSWLVFFLNGTAELTNESKLTLQLVKDAVRAFAAPEVIVIGHTDSVGTMEMNDKLSLQRALSIRNHLVAAGVPPEKIEVVGRGERELLVPTADEVPEERNRRVQVKVR